MDFEYIEGKIIVFKNYTLYADNFYNSEELLKILIELNECQLLELKPKSLKRKKADTKDLIAIIIIAALMLLFLLSIGIISAILNLRYPIFEIAYFVFMLILACLNVKRFQNQNLSK